MGDALVSRDLNLGVDDGRPMYFPMRHFAKLIIANVKLLIGGGVLVDRR
jgi:hypothetical protein